MSSWTDGLTELTRIDDDIYNDLKAVAQYAAFEVHYKRLLQEKRVKNKDWEGPQDHELNHLATQMMNNNLKELQTDFAISVHSVMSSAIELLKVRADPNSTIADIKGADAELSVELANFRAVCESKEPDTELRKGYMAMVLTIVLLARKKEVSPKADLSEMVTDTLAEAVIIEGAGRQ